MEVKATVVCENTVFRNYGTIAEHGLAIFIETKNGNYLIDTGQGKAIVNNAAILKTDLRSIKGIILSHHHLDHTGGLIRVLEITGRVNTYSHPDLFKQSFNIGGEVPRYTGIPFCRPMVESKGANLIFNKEFTEISTDFYLTGEVPRHCEFEVGDKDQVVNENGKFVKDYIMDDQSVVVKTKKGLFIILGCCHAGIVNTINHIIEKTGVPHIHAIIGGTHLGPVSEKQRSLTIQELNTFDIDRIGVSHCTGLKTASRLSSVFRERFFFCNVGAIVTA
jgi:7,8-dihydropterin-6-yl-methyl-4-(beta-D-ribofuranosyl)aminobenzene 5'-phosphate synthase